uniref:EIF2B subunit epsilon/gamma LbH domain-containing protein n=1 Tax=Arion vulgaris TaxID=1028688 RepID=A0A0B7B0B2_9EUPU
MSVFVRHRPKEDTDMSGTGSDDRVDKKKDLVDFAAESESDLTNSVKFLSLTSKSFGLSEDTPQTDLIGCYAYRQTNGFCVRANTIGAYFESCKQMPRLISKFLPAKKKDTLLNMPDSTTIKAKSQVGTDCMLGDSVIIGEKVSIKKSVVGKHCKIGDKVKITNSVIMEHVTIQDSCNISNCIIADSANIGDKCDLSNCIIGQNQSIPTMSKHTNEVVSNLSQMMEVSLE